MSFDEKSLRLFWDLWLLIADCCILEKLGIVLDIIEILSGRLFSGETSQKQETYAKFSNLLSSDFWSHMHQQHLSLTQSTADELKSWYEPDAEMTHVSAGICQWLQSLTAHGLLGVDVSELQCLWQLWIQERDGTLLSCSSGCLCLTPPH